MTAASPPAASRRSGEMIAAAVDLGAGSGRVITARIGADRLDRTATHRFANTPVRAHGTLHWNILALWQGILDGLRAAGPLDSIGVDSWAVDYGLLDDTGALLGNPAHYRDERTHAIADLVADRLGRERLYATTGLQHQPFNTIFQLAAAHGSPQLAAARSLLLIPDLINYWLTGHVGAETTNASTTQLFDQRHRAWATDVITDLNIDPALLPPLHEPGALLGRTGADLQLPGDPHVVAVASHDTASAIAAVPTATPHFAYISCGTWSLTGIELDAPVLTEASRAANFTNEAGIDATIRYLRNIMGLWLLQESLRAWGDPDLNRLLHDAATQPAFAAVIDPDHPMFLPPGDMPARIAAYCHDTKQPAPRQPAAVVRCILDSLALAHRRAVRQAQLLSGHHVDAVHIVGGGARNSLLCQLTADACGLPVIAGPVEATALGNLLVQARAAGAVSGDRRALRALVRSTQRLTTYHPATGQTPWAAAAARLGWQD
jgi:sugar (pentulose or hexulose) kinase